MFSFVYMLGACLFSMHIQDTYVSGRKITQHTATFEKVDSFGNQIPTAELPGVYDDLNFLLFQKGPFNYAAGFPTGVAPQSFPGLAVFGYGFTTPDGPATLSAAYKDSRVESFDLTDFYFGCQALYNFTTRSDSEINSYPQNCTMVVSGYPGDDTSRAPDAAATFKFLPAYQTNPRVGAEYSVMTHAILPPTFKNLRAATFQVFNASRVALSSPAAYVDNISFSVKKS